MSKGLRNLLQRYVSIVCKRYESHGLKVYISDHFMQRVIERSEMNYDRAVYFIADFIEANVCLILYYINLDCALPERGKINHKGFEIRGNVIDGVFHFSTFFKES